jgi:serine/threonine protein kinase
VIDDKERIHLGPEHIKAYMKMILEGMDFLHRNWVLHRYEITGISLMRASFLCKTSVCQDKLRPEIRELNSKGRFRRDMKPDNVLVAEDGRLMITGDAKSLKSLKSSSSFEFRSGN